MICTNSNCSKIQYCRKIHESNGYKLNENTSILIPNDFFFELNLNNRFAKIGVPRDGFNYGCMKLIDKGNSNYSFYINDDYIDDFSFSDLLNTCNEVFHEMISNGEIKIGY